MRDALDGVRGDIEFEDVVFEYNEGAPVLKGFVQGRRGPQRYFVGSSGSGKSTLISLVIISTVPNPARSGSTGAGGLTGVKLREYRAYLQVVLQDNFLFDD